MKNILVIGDYSRIANYGAIATTEFYKSTIKEKYPGCSIEYIEYRSIHHPTPPEGWENTDLANISKKKTSVKRFIKVLLKKLYLYNLIIWIVALLKRKDNNSDFVPYLFSDFEKYASMMLKGDILLYEHRLISKADLIYINAEGNVVNGTDKHGKYRIGARYLFFISYMVTKHYKKKCIVNNHTVDPNNDDAIEIIKNVYPLCEKIIVREKLSIELLSQFGIKNNVKFAPDVLFGYKENTSTDKLLGSLSSLIDFNRPYICLGDSSGINSNYNSVRWDVLNVYTQLVEKLKVLIPQIIFIDGFNEQFEPINKLVKQQKISRLSLMNCNYHQLYEVLKRSEIFVSGRWHSSILSLLGNTPIVLWGSDSHKTKGLYNLMPNYNIKFYNISTLPIHIDELTRDCGKILSNREEYVRIIKENIDPLRNQTYENFLW